MQRNYLDFYSFVFLIEKCEKDNLVKTDGEISEAIKVSLDVIEKILEDILKEQKKVFGVIGASLGSYSTYLVYEYLVRKKIN